MIRPCFKTKPLVQSVPRNPEIGRAYHLLDTKFNTIHANFSQIFIENTNTRKAPMKRKKEDDSLLGLKITREFVCIQKSCPARYVIGPPVKYFQKKSSLVRSVLFIDNHSHSISGKNEEESNTAPQESPEQPSEFSRTYDIAEVSIPNNEFQSILVPRAIPEQSPSIVSPTTLETGMDIAARELIPQDFNGESNGENSSNENNSSVFDFSDHLDPEPSKVSFTASEVPARVNMATEEMSPERVYDDPMELNTSNEKKEDSSSSECFAIPSVNDLTDHQELPNIEGEDQDSRSMKEQFSLNPTRPLTSTPKKLTNQKYGNAFKSLRKAFKKIMGTEFESQGGSKGKKKEQLIYLYIIFLQELFLILEVDQLRKKGKMKQWKKLLLRPKVIPRKKCIVHQL